MNKPRPNHIACPKELPLVLTHAHLLLGLLLCFSAVLVSAKEETAKNTQQKVKSIDGQSTVHHKQLCRDTVNAYAIHRDSGDAGAFGALFDAQAKVTVLGKTSVGREQVVQGMLTRFSQGPTLHNMGTVHIAVSESGVITGVSYAEVFRLTQSEGQAPKSKLLGKVKYLDTFQIKDQQCLITTRVMEMVASGE